jgi:quinol monooxygenase YgiN
MIIVVGTFEVAPEDRDAFLASKRGLMARTRDEAGCIDYAYSADAGSPGRIRLIERWEAMPDLQAHVEGLQAAAGSDSPAGSKGPTIPALSSEVHVYEASPAPVPWD